MLERLGRYIRIQVKEKVCPLPCTESEQRLDTREKAEIFTVSIMSKFTEKAQEEKGLS